MEKGGSRTDGDHAFAVVVQILEHHLAQRVDLPRPRRREVFGQEFILLFQTTHQARELPYYAEVAVHVDGVVIVVAATATAAVAATPAVFEHDAEVEDELVAVVLVVRDADRVS